MQRQVVVDDTDPQIQYTGIGWFKDQGSQDNNGNWGPTYRKTSHGTKSSDSFSFSFSGTSVTVLGTTHLVKIDNGTRFDPTIECFVDQVSIGSTKPFEFPENNWSLCGRGGLNDGQHTITVKIMTTGNTFWFDYLTYMPSPKVSFDEAVLYVENTDPAVIFGAGWGDLGGIANQTTRAGSQAKFDFIGKSLSWVGFVPTELPHGAATGSFVIDNGQPMEFKLNGLSATETTTQYNQVFFTTPDLAPGPHSIVVTYKGGNGPSTPLTLDHLYVTNISIPLPAAGGVITGATTGATAGATTGGTTGGTTGLTTGLTTGGTKGATAGATTGAATGATAGASAGATTGAIAVATSSSPSAIGGSQGNGQAKTPPVGAIVGGVLGGLALIFLILLLLWLRRRRRRETKHHIGESGEVNPFLSTQSETGIDESRSGTSSTQASKPPFTQPSSSTSRNPSSLSEFSRATSPAYPIPNVSRAPSTIDSKASYTRHPTQANIYANTVNFNSAAGTTDQPPAMRERESGPSRLSVAPVHHQDSGIRLPSQAVTNEVPPPYTLA